MYKRPADLAFRPHSDSDSESDPELSKPETQRQCTSRAPTESIEPDENYFLSEATRAITLSIAAGSAIPQEDIDDAVGSYFVQYPHGRLAGVLRSIDPDDPFRATLGKELATKMKQGLAGLGFEDEASAISSRASDLVISHFPVSFMQKLKDMRSEAFEETRETGRLDQAVRRELRSGRRAHESLGSSDFRPLFDEHVEHVLQSTWRDPEGADFEGTWSSDLFERMILGGWIDDGLVRTRDGKVVDAKGKDKITLIDKLLEGQPRVPYEPVRTRLPKVGVRYDP